MTSRMSSTFTWIACLAIALSGTVAAETYRYDAVGRLVEVGYETNSFVRYSYDANGNIVQVQAGEDRILSTGFESETPS